MPDPIAKSLSRLSREKLIELCISWTKSSQCDPYLVSNRNLFEAEEEDYLHEPAQTPQELTSLYSAFKHNQAHHDLVSLSKKDIIDRIIDGDWRRGLSYHQLASIDCAALDEDDTSLRWSALKLVPLREAQIDSVRLPPTKRRRLDDPMNVAPSKSYPDTTAHIFVQNLKSHISPLVKAHYHIHRLESLKTSIVRLHIQKGSPFAPLSSNVPRQGRFCIDNSRSMYIALPDSCPYVYISVSGPVSGGTAKKNGKGQSAKVDIVAMKKIVLEAIPKAFSRPQERWSIEHTKLTAKSLRTMLLLRGNAKVGTLGGSFSKLIQPVADINLEPRERDNVSEEQWSIDATCSDVRNTLVKERFGVMAGETHASLDRVHIRVRSLTPSLTSQSKKRKRSDQEENEDNTHTSSSMTITLSGSDVFAGLKQFALRYPHHVDLDKIPAMLSGEGEHSQITL